MHIDEANPGFYAKVTFKDIHLADAIAMSLFEMDKQDETWGENRIQNGLLWQTILSEEVGEVAKEILEQDQQKMLEELTQVAAVALNWMKAILRNEVPPWMD